MTSVASIPTRTIIRFENPGWDPINKRSHGPRRRPVRVPMTPRGARCLCGAPLDFDELTGEGFCESPDCGVFEDPDLL